MLAVWTVMLSLHSNKTEVNDERLRSTSTVGRGRSCTVSTLIRCDGSLKTLLLIVLFRKMSDLLHGSLVDAAITLHEFTHRCEAGYQSCCAAGGLLIENNEKRMNAVEKKAEVKSRWDTVDVVTGR
ncbi:hypothetical protein F2P81_015394 [Scophthalmus maximus]|uniref:Uncharacterized protein n=1 Tax=Scophthalmus maximus TaxID=52904 RepID=A0A6A4SPW2_SCOMX|nr:hypothetical protein F2P81_015394 [Scophthalmus maximus]